MAGLPAEMNVNDLMWHYGGTISELRRKIERMETAAPHRRIAELEAEVETLRAENKRLVGTWYAESADLRKWMSRAYAAEKPAVGAGEVHELRERLVDHLAVTAERDTAKAEVAELRAAVATAREDLTDWMRKHADLEIQLREAREKIAAMEEAAGIARHEVAKKDREVMRVITDQRRTITGLQDQIEMLTCTCEECKARRSNP